ncbi:MAG TPA: hypothetical protein VKI99_09360 [Candidatus Dormibacteraeota bacterium]|nr:hypothetical protein [Candidatus Dormibacteraeota bacterium]
MTNDSESGGGFGWGLLVGLALGFVAGAALASGPGREQMKTLRARTIELTGTARRVARDPEHPIGRAINDGIAAANRRRQELERTARDRWQERKDVAKEAQPDA